MKLSVTQTQVTYLLQQLRNQREPVGGMLFFEVVTKSRLDGTPESIERLESIFTLIRQKGLTLEKILTHPQHKNFLLTIAAYLGQYIGQIIDEVPNWIAYDNFPTFQEDPSAPREFAFSLIAQFGYGVCLPFGAVMTALSTDFSFKEYIADTSNNILSKSQVNLLAPACDICNLFLKKVRTGRLVDSTIAYLNLLQKIDFDYSYQSLEKIDKVLEYIKTTEMIPQGRNLHQSNYDDFVNDPARQIFIYLLGCYIGMSSAQLAKTTVKWFNHEQMQEILDDPDYFFSIENNHVMMFDKGYLRLPLMAITNYLFDLNPNSSIGAVGFADNVLRDNASTLISYPLITQGLDPVPTSWHTAATLAGTLAAWNLVHASDGGDFSPMSLDYDLKTKKINLISHMGSDLDVLMGQLDIPSPDSPFGFLSYDMYANLPTGRTDGITIEIRVYSEPKLTLQLILPYRHADHPLGFALYPLVHKQDNHSLSVNELDSLIQAFYQGAKNIKDPFIGVDYWTSYYLDKHDLFAPPAWINHAVETFDPNNSEIELLQIH